MTRSEGRFVFFNALARALQTIYPIALPHLILLELRGHGGLPKKDVIEIACALCRFINDELSNVPVYPVSRIATLWQDHAAVVVDAEGLQLAEVFSLIDDRPSATEVLVIFNWNIDSGSDGQFSRVVFDVETQHTILGQALDELFKRIDRRVDSLARARFRRRGFGGLESLGLFEGPPAFDFDDDSSVELFCQNISEGWQYNGSPVDSENVYNWLRQFQQSGFANEARYILFYLRREGFLTERQIAQHLSDQYEALASSVGYDPIGIVLQPPGKSELKLAYRLKTRVQIVTMSAAIEIARKNTNNEFVCFDDFIGSGESVRDAIFDSKKNEFADEIINMFKNKNLKLTVIVSHADENGIRKIRDYPESYGAVNVMAWRTITDSRRAFSSGTMIFPDETKMVAFRDFCKSIGKKIYPKHPLGWQDCQWCIATDYTVPNCSLPILFCTGNKRKAWTPLFPRQRMTGRQK